MQLLLFDIDGTLVNTGGAGSRAMTKAFSEVCGISDAFQSFSMAGMTDPLILEKAVAIAEENGLKFSCNYDEVYRAYVDYLREELESGTRPYQVLPGVSVLLEELKDFQEIGIGLATGNIAEGARVKLEHGKISHYFNFGGYGSDHGNRTHVVKQAVQRGSEYVAPAEVTRVIVIGDTPRDIIHAKEAGVAVIAVATGFHSRETLAEFGPDLVLDSLEDRPAFREFLAIQ